MIEMSPQIICSFPTSLASTHSLSLLGGYPIWQKVKGSGHPGWALLHHKASTERKTATINLNYQFWKIVGENKHPLRDRERTTSTYKGSNPPFSLWDNSVPYHLIHFFLKKGFLLILINFILISKKFFVFWTRSISVNFISARSFTHSIIYLYK